MARIISVFGPSGSGVSVFSTILSLVLAKKNNVTTVYCDSTTPTIPTIYPQGVQLNSVNKDEIKSLGKVLSSVNITDNDVLKNMVTLPKISRLSLLGYSYGESSDDYAIPTTYDIVDLFNKLNGLTDYIVVDCGSNITDPIASIALENSDNIIRICGCTYKDLCYYASNLRLVPESNIKLNEHIKVFPKCEVDDSPENLRSFYGSVDYTIDKIPDINNQVRAGELFIKKPNSKYVKKVEKIVKEMNYIG